MASPRSTDARISRVRAELVARLSHGGPAGRALPAPPAAGRADDPFPLSTAQHGVWLSEQLGDSGAAFNVPGALLLSGDVDLPALRRSLAGVLSRHESLRTSVSVDKGVPVQRVHPTAAISLPVCDLSGLPEARRRAALKQVLGADGCRPFQLDVPPPLRVRVLRRRDGESILAITMHHLMCDGWSMRLFLSELAAHYNAAHAGGGAALPPLPRQYRDYVSWHHQQVESGRLDADLAYWRTQLGGELAVLRLPTDRGRRPTDSRAGGTHRFRVDAGVVERLKSVAREAGATTFVSMLSAFQAWLHAYSRQPDVIAGTDVANRRPEFKDVIGLFANQVAIRTSFAGDPSFRDILGRVHRAALDALAHQALPFEHLVRALNPPRHPSTPPIFQVKFVFDERASMLPRFDGLTVGFMDVPKRLAKFDLTLFARLLGGELFATLEYDADLFDLMTVARMAAELVALMDAVGARPDRRLSALRLPCGRDNAAPGSGRAKPAPFRAITPRPVPLTPR